MKLKLTGALALFCALAWPSRARADLLPTCDQQSSLITCAPADVGKPCQGAGMCYAIPCSAAGSSTTNMVYKCDACPTVLAAPDGGCSPANLGTACGDGGTCSGSNGYCVTSGSKFVCSIPAASQPTGPPAGETDGGGTSTGSGGGGCDVAPGAPATAGLIAIGLVAIGLLFMAIARRRRRSR